MTHFEIVKKLVGEVKPAGETSKDEKRFENLQAMCELTAHLISEIQSVARDNKHSHEYSVKRSADYAERFLSNATDIPF